MGFLKGRCLGTAIGCGLAALAGVYRPYAIGLGIAAAVLLVVLPSPGRRARLAAQSSPIAPTATGPTLPSGFFTGRRLGDALAWIAQDRGVTTLEQLAVTEETVAVTDLGPTGRRFTVVSDEGGAFRADSVDGAAEPGAGLDTSGRFQARDLAPDVLTRALDRARREHPETWTHVADLEAVVDRPDRLRNEVTVRLHNGAPEAEDETLWVSAAGDLLYVQRSLA